MNTQALYLKKYYHNGKTTDMVDIIKLTNVNQPIPIPFPSLPSLPSSHLSSSLSSLLFSHFPGKRRDNFSYKDPCNYTGPT